MSIFEEIFKNKYCRRILVVAGVFISMKYLLPLVLPFVIALLFVALINPLLEKIHKKTKLGKGLFAAIFLTMAGFIFIGILAVLGGVVFSNVGGWIENFEMIEVQIITLLQTCCNELEKIIGIDAIEIEEIFVNKINGISASVQAEFGPKLMGESISYAKDLLSIGTCVAVVFIAVVLLAKDYSKIKDLIESQKEFSYLEKMLGKIGELVKVFAKAQILILITISVLCVAGLLIIGVDNAISLGILTGCLDILPFIGTALVLLPLAILLLLAGETGKALGIVILYVISVFVRELLEPKLIGDKVGIPPIYILMGIYVGIKVYGISGIILGPLSLLIINELTSTNQK